MIIAKINQEVARGATVLTGRIPYLGGSEGLDGALELESQWVIHGNVSTKFHAGGTGTGLMS
jgi:hypothetical protein